MHGYNVTMRTRLAALLLLTWTALPGPAGAGSGIACVRCDGPSQTYRCRAMSDESVPDDALRYFCMAQIAREHAHQRCTAPRDAASCSGVDVSYVYQDGVADQPTRTRAPEPAAEPTFSFSDMTAKAGRAIGDATSKAGHALGEATRKTLKCLGTALNGC